MTSQFAAINSEGIALASDSAVTISGREQRSTFNRVNKIFPLGGEHQIAIMICGSPNYLPGNVSWNRIVGLFKNDLKKARLDSFDDYVDNFRRFLKNTTILNDPRQNNLAIQRCLWSWFASSCKAVEAYLAYQKGGAEIIYGQLELETDELEMSLQWVVEEATQAIHEGANFLIKMNSFVFDGFSSQFAFFPRRREPCERCEPLFRLVGLPLMRHMSGQSHSLTEQCVLNFFKIGYFRI